MKLKNIEINKDGEIETVWLLSPDQYYFLVHYAVNDLLLRGLVQSEKLTEEEFKKMQAEALQDSKAEFLENIDIDHMSKN